MELLSPEFALQEINKYRQDIIEKNNLSEKEFEQIRFDLAIAIKFIPIEGYSQKLQKALEISPDPNDLEFFALAIKLKLPIWSNDLKLKKQSKIKIITTTELINMPEIKKIASSGGVP